MGIAFKILIFLTIYFVLLEVVIINLRDPWYEKWGMLLRAVLYASVIIVITGVYL